MTDLFKKLINTLLIGQVMPQFYLKTASGTFLDLFGDGYGVTRKTGQRTQGTLSFSRIDPADELTVPSGTIISSLPVNNTVYQLTLLADAVFPSGASSTTGTAEAVTIGGAYNLESGYYDQIQFDGVTVTNETGWITQLGADDESDDDFRLRIRNAFNTLSSYHTDGIYRRLISEFAGIPVDGIWFLHDAPRGPGTANAYLLFDLATPADSVLTSINRQIMDDGNHGHGDDLLVLAMPEQLYSLTCTLYLTNDILEAERAQVEYNVEQAIRCAFRENAAYTEQQITRVQPKSRFSLAKLTGELIRLFPELESLEFDRSDIVSGLHVPALDELTVQRAA